MNQVIMEMTDCYILLLEIHWAYWLICPEIAIFYLIHFSCFLICEYKTTPYFSLNIQERSN
jgi:hypothetical protein